MWFFPIFVKFAVDGYGKSGYDDIIDKGWIMFSTT